MSKQSRRLIQIILAFLEYVNFKFLYFFKEMSRILDFLQELSENLKPHLPFFNFHINYHQ